MMSLSSKEIHISISKQELYLFELGAIKKTYKISSSKYGEGSELGSFKTPLGKHEVKKLIGHDEKIGMRFIGRIPSEIFPMLTTLALIFLALKIFKSYKKFLKKIKTR